MSKSSSTKEFLENCTDQERREFWDIYRTLENDHLLFKVMQLAADLDADDLHELTEYAIWLREESSICAKISASNTISISTKKVLDELEVIEDKWADRVESNSENPLALTVKNMLTSLCRDVEHLIFGEKPAHNLVQTKLDFLKVIGDLYMRLPKAMDQTEREYLQSEIDDLKRVDVIITNLFDCDDKGVH